MSSKQAVNNIFTLGYWRDELKLLVNSGMLKYLCPSLTQSSAAVTTSTGGAGESES